MDEGLPLDPSMEWFRASMHASPPMRLAHDATDALADDMGSHGQRLNPARLAELRQTQISLMQYHGHIGPSGEDLNPFNHDTTSPRERAREDPLAAVGGLVRPSPYALLHTISAGLLPQTPHVTPTPLREMRSEGLGRYGNGGGEVAQKWLRQVASEAQIHRRSHVKRTKLPELLRPLYTALEVHAQKEHCDGMPEPARLSGRTKLYVATILEKIVPKVGALDSGLGMALQATFQELTALIEQYEFVSRDSCARLALVEAS